MRKGFSLIEITLASALFGVVVLGVVGVFGYSNLNEGREKALFLADEGLTIASTFIESDFDGIESGIYGIGVQGLVNIPDEVDGYVRTVMLEKDGQFVYATSTVSWVGGEVALASLVGNWKRSVQVGTVSIDVSGAIASDKTLSGVIVRNEGNATSTISSMILSWSGISGGAKLKSITAGGVNVWSGNNSNGQIADISDIDVAEDIPLVFEWSKSIIGSIMQIIVILPDGTQVVSEELVL